MAKKSTKEKKLRRKQNQEAQLKRDEIKFDVIGLLRDQPLETKPEVGDFLKQYVKSIRILVDHSKITVYPVNEYTINKVFIDFLDGHQIILDLNVVPCDYFFYDSVDEIHLTEKTKPYVIKFVDKLREFEFIH